MHTTPKLGIWVAILIAAFVVSALSALLLETPSLNIAQVWSDPYYRHVTIFSFYQSFLSTLISVGLAIPLSHALSRRNFLGKSLLLKLFASTLVMPVLVGVFGLLAIYGNSGLLATLFGWLNQPLPFSIYGLNGILLAIALGLTASLKLTKEQSNQIEQAAKQVGILGYLDRLPEQLSGGQRQRAALARCFVQPHPIWLLDEPFSGLDPVLREEMLDLVKQLATERNITVLMVTHHISDAQTVASHFAFIDKGEILLTDSIEKLTDQHTNQTFSDFIKASS